MTALAPQTIPPMSLGRVIAAYLSDAKYESLRLLRTPAFFGVVLNGGPHRPPGFGDFMFVGWTVYGVMGPGLFGFGILVAVERNMGLLTFKRALPMPTGSYLAAKLMMAYIFALVVMAMLVTAGEDMTARVWAATSGRRLQTLTHDGVVYDLAFSPDGRLLATTYEPAGRSVRIVLIS